MAIAPNPLVALPPGDEALWSREVAIPWQYRAPHRSGRPEGRLPEPEDLVAMATRLATRAASWPGMARPARRRWALMAASTTAEAWVIAWPPGGAIELHDHGGSAGAVVVAAGELVETSIVSGRSGSVAQRSTTIPASGSISFDGRHVHDIVNLGPGPAVSVHVYAPRLTSMTYYRVVEGALETGATVRYLFGEAVP
jgi:hypothetical protein